jgi:hypothetical protein
MVLACPDLLDLLNITSCLRGWYKQSQNLKISGHSEDISPGQILVLE